MSLLLPYKDDVKQWSVEQLAAWLQQREMPDIADIYLRKGIDGHKFITLGEGEHITILNILSLRERLDVLNIIKKIKNQQHSISNHKIQLPKSHPQNNNNKLNQTSAPLHLASNSTRYSASSITSAENILYGENGVSDSSVSCIEEGLNEDYLIPLSTGLGSITPDPPSQGIPKKDRCPSPILQTQNKLRERNKIQDLKLPPPPPPPSSQNKKFIPPCVEGKNKFGHLGNFSDKNGSRESEKIAEQKEDFNAYEIIQEKPAKESESRNVDNQDTDAKPPDLPYRNISQSFITPPVVPIRTHASTQHQHPTLHRPPVRSPDTQPLLSSSKTSFIVPPTSHLLRTTNSTPGRLPNPKNNLTKPKFPTEGGSQVQCLPSSLEMLHLSESKSVPMNSTYRSLLDKDYFHPVIRNVLPNLLTEDGMFLVRPSTHSQHLLTLSISNKGKIFNIVIRSRDDSKFALGTQKPGEIAFFSVDDLIKFHKREPIKVEDGSLVYLKSSPMKDKTL